MPRPIRRDPHGLPGLHVRLGRAAAGGSAHYSSCVERAHGGDSIGANRRSKSSAAIAAHCRADAQGFCRCAAVYGGVYVLRRSLRTIHLAPTPPPSAGDVAETVAQPAAEAGRLHFHGGVCTAGQRLSGRYLVASREHVAGLLRGTGAAGKAGGTDCVTDGNVVARAVCLASGSVVDGGSTMLAVVPRGTAGGESSSGCGCVRLQQYEPSAQVGPAGVYVLHLTVAVSPPP